jgi:hypothetical protein
LKYPGQNCSLLSGRTGRWQMQCNKIFSEDFIAGAIHELPLQ